jgi:type II secretory pathway pseudopilin PulG
MASAADWTEGRLGPPRLNLLPGEIRERRLVRRQRAAVGAAIVALLALLGLWYALEHREAAEARREADREQALAAGLRAHKTELQPYADLEGQIAAAERLRTQVYAHEIRFSAVMQDIAEIVPDDVWLTKMSAAFNDATRGGTAPTTGAANASASSGQATTATPGSPGAGSPVASITFAGAGLGHVDVGGFMRALAGGPTKNGKRVYENPYFTSSQKSGEQGSEATVTFSATVDLSEVAYSGRFQPAGQSGTVTP